MIEINPVGPMYCDLVFARLDARMGWSPLIVRRSGVECRDAAVLSALRLMDADVMRLACEPCSSAEFWRVFAGHVHRIEDIAGPDGWSYVLTQFQQMLERCGVAAIPDRRDDVA